MAVSPSIYLIPYVELCLCAGTVLTYLSKFIFVSRGVRNVICKFFLTSTEQRGSSQQYSVTLASYRVSADNTVRSHKHFSRTQ